VLQEKILQQNFLEKCSEFTEQKNRLLKFIVVVSVLAFFLSIGITMAVSQPDSIPGLVTMNDFGEIQYIGPVSRKTIKTLMFQSALRELIGLINTSSYKLV
jgi:type IV secretion system protein VirB5